MNRHRLFIGTVIAALLLLITGLTYAQEPGPETDVSTQAALGTAFTYQGQLTDGGSPAGGAYDFRFTLYDAATGGSQVGSTVTKGDVDVSEGLFTVRLDFGDVFDGTALWMSVRVRPGSSTGSYTTLSPRHALTAAPYAAYANKVGDHDHLGEFWYTASGYGLRVMTSDSTKNAFEASIGPRHVTSNNGVYAETATGNGVYGRSNISGKAGVLGYNSGGGYGVLAHSENGTSLYVPGAGASGVLVAGAGRHGVRVYSAGNDGVRVDSASWSGVYVASSGGDAIRVQTAGNDGLRFYKGMGRDYIRAGSDADVDFKVKSDGEVRSDVGFHAPADFAELMTTEDDPAGYEAGDVLVISVQADRSAELSSEPYSTLVLGVYSEKPGFVGSPHPMEDPADDEIPVAVVGVVPCKVSAENGPIHRGDLLVTSSMPGHAMRADDAPAGTIVGKALEPLEEGTGTIEVLVTLQ